MSSRALFASSLAFWRRKLLVLTWLKENIHYSCACMRTSSTTLRLPPRSFNTAVAYETEGWSIILPSAWTVSFLSLMASIVGFASFAVEKLGPSFLFSVYLGCYISTAHFDPPNSLLVFTVFQWWTLLSYLPSLGASMSLEVDSPSSRSGSPIVRLFLWFCFLYMVSDYVQTKYTSPLCYSVWFPVLGYPLHSLTCWLAIRIHFQFSFFCCALRIYMCSFDW